MEKLKSFIKESSNNLKSEDFDQIFNNIGETEDTISELIKKSKIDGVYKTKLLDAIKMLKKADELISDVSINFINGKEEKMPSINQSTPEINAARYLTIRKMGGDFSLVKDKHDFMQEYENFAHDYYKRDDYFKYYNKIKQKDPQILNRLNNDKTYQRLLKFINK